MNSIHNYQPDKSGELFDGASAQPDMEYMQIPLADKTVNTEVSGDFSLPDYQPEIKRLLKIGATVHPPTHYTGADEVEINGGLDYFVFYVGSDGGLYCAPLNTDYRFNVPLNDDAGMDGVTPTLCLCQSTAESTVGRVTAPRRLNIRCRLRSRVQVLGERTAGVANMALDPNSTEALHATEPVCRMWEAESQPLVLQDDIIPDMHGGGVRVVCSEGQVMVTDAAAGMGVVNCRGEITLKLTMCPTEPDADGQMLPFVLSRKIPFSEAVEMPGVTPDCHGCATGVCSDISAQIEEGHIHVETALRLRAMAQKNQSVAYVKDLYSTRKSCSCQYVQLPIHHAVRSVTGNFTQSESMPLSEAGIPPVTRILDIGGVAYPEEVTVHAKEGRCVLVGTCHYQLLFLRDGEYAVSELDLPFRYEIEATADEGAAFCGNVAVMTCRSRMDGERIGIDAELAVNGRIYQPDTLTILSDVTPGDPLSRPCGEYVICFPSSDDSLWSVAKRYHAPLSVLSAANSIAPGAAIDAPESIAGNHYLIV